MLGLTLKDDTRLSLGPSSEIRLDRFAYAPAEGRLGFVLNVVRGRRGVRLGTDSQARTRLGSARNAGGDCRRARDHAGHPRFARMNNARLVAFLMATAAAGMLSACGPQQVRAPEPPPDPKTATLVVLLPDRRRHDGARGGLGQDTSQTTNKPASVELTGARQSTLVGLNGPAPR